MMSVRSANLLKIHTVRPTPVGSTQLYGPCYLRLLDDQRYRRRYNLNETQGRQSCSL